MYITKRKMFKGKEMIPMKNLMNKIKKNNKGFTLVELIVVIAVLAIITVVAAPQYIKYVEKSRVGTDENALGEIAHIAGIQWVELQSDDDTTNDDSNTITLSITNGSLSYDTGKLAASVAVVMPAGQYEFVSDEYKTSTVEIKVSAAGIATWEKK